MSEEMEIDELVERLRQMRDAAKVAMENLDFRVAGELNEEAQKLEKEIERREQHGQDTVQSSGE